VAAFPAAPPIPPELAWPPVPIAPPVPGRASPAVPPSRGGDSEDEAPQAVTANDINSDRARLGGGAIREQGYHRASPRRRHAGAAPRTRRDAMTSALH